MKSCITCDKLPAQLRIDHPIALTQIITETKRAVTNGCLVVVRCGEWAPAFDELTDSHPWDAIVDYGFKCAACGCQYQLFAETERGSGGWWKPIA
jgi:hypothetical protein